MQSVMEACESTTSFILPSKLKRRKVSAIRDFPEGLTQFGSRNINLISKTDGVFESDDQSEEQVAVLMEGCESIPCFVPSKPYQERKVFAKLDFPEGLKKRSREINLVSETDDAYESDDPSEEPDELVIESERMESLITCDQEVADLVTVSALPGNSKGESIGRLLRRTKNQDLENVKEDSVYDELEDGPALRKAQIAVADDDSSDESEELYEVPYGIVGKFGILTRYPAYHMAMTQNLCSTEDDADESEEEDESCDNDLDFSEISETEEVDDQSWPQIID